MQNKVLKIIGYLAGFAVFPLLAWFMASNIEGRAAAIFVGIIMFVLFVWAVFKIIKQPQGKE